KAVDTSIDARRHGLAVIASEQERDHVPNLRLGHHVTADWCPEPGEGLTSEPLGASVVVQALRRLRGVEVDVPAFLLHDASQHLGQHRMTATLREPRVAGLRGP